MVQLDRTDDIMVPPWEKFPDYERHTLGWRMGVGEEYLDDYYTFIQQLSNDYQTRLNYLKSHRPAPLNWDIYVLSILYPDRKSKREFGVGCSPTEILNLLNLGLVEHDAAYHTWLQQQEGIVLPWLWFVSETPEQAARYNLREFWFFSRQLTDLRERGNFQIEQVPSEWQSVELQLRTGRLGDIDPTDGLLTLARMLCAGLVQPPWELDLSPDNFTDSFEMDMGYTDAFRLWIMSAFDDDLLLREMLHKTGIPANWADWVKEHAET
jgi:hypothetical protein